MKLLTDIIHSSEEIHMEPAEKAMVELQRYLSDVITDQFDTNGHLDTLQWWKLNIARYPCVSMLARKYVAIPATSVPSERAFSLTGHLVNEKKSSSISRDSKHVSFFSW